MAQKKYIVTGGAGFVGSHVADALVDEGHDVHIVDTFITGRREHVNQSATLHEIDIRNLDALVPIFKGADGVFHLAAQPRMQLSIDEPLLTHDLNSRGTLTVLMAAHKAGVRRVVYSASSSAYGDTKDMPLRESMCPNPVIPYAIQKHVGELYCRSASTFYDVETVCLRYFNVYGPRQTTDVDGPYATVIGIFLGKRAKGEPMPIVPDGSQRRDFTHVTDTARANVLAMQSSAVGDGEIINIGTSKSYSVLDVANMIGGPSEFTDPRKGEVFETRADITRAKELLGWEPSISLEDGIAKLKTDWNIV